VKQIGGGERQSGEWWKRSPFYQNAERRGERCGAPRDVVDRVVRLSGDKRATHGSEQGSDYCANSNQTKKRKKKGDLPTGGLQVRVIWARAIV
jgi:hypothetical protein